jgi:TolB-like protein/AraC-like DNA-binding protein/tetratricopeptide (TPR) repeat protein
MRSWKLAGFNNKSTDSARQNSFLTKLKNIIEENLNNEQFGVEDLAERMNMDRTQVYRKVKSITNKSVSKFIRERRLEKALELLKNNELTVSEIAYTVGFGSPTYFNKCFHEYYGFSPGELRKKEFDGCESRKSTNRRLYYYIAGFSLMIIAFIVIWNHYSNNRSTVEKIMTYRSIAILSFEDQSPDGNHEWLGDAVADEIINILSHNENLKVIGKTSSFSFKDKDATIKEIGETLNVETVLKGSVNKIGDQIRITSQLIVVKNEEVIRADKYDRPASDIFQIIDNVAMKLTVSLLSEISDEDVKDIKMTYQPKVEAFEYFTKGIQLLLEFVTKRDNNETLLIAAEMFQKAISIDTGYVDAITGLAHVYWTYGAFSGDEGEAYFALSDSVLSIAERLDSNTPYSLYLKGFVSLDPDSGFYFLKKAYDLDPYNVGSPLLVNKLINSGFHNLSLTLCNRYLERDPLNPILRDWQVSSLWNMGQTEAAREQLNKGLEFYPDHYFLHFINFSISLLVDKDPVEAKRISEFLDQIDSVRGLCYMRCHFRKALILAVEGRKEEALRESKDWPVYAILGMKQEAIAKLDSAIKNHPYQWDNKDYYYGYLSLKHKVVFDNIREEPRFQELLKEAKIEYDIHMEKYGHLLDN